MASTCPICRKPALPRAENGSAPFCSPRCRQVDLGKWLTEEYRMPTAEVPDEKDLEIARATMARKPELEN